MVAPVGQPAELLAAAPETPVAWRGTSPGAAQNRCEFLVPMMGPTQHQASPPKRLMPAERARAEQEREQPGERARMKPAESWTAVLEEPSGSWPAGLALRAAWAASLRPRCAGYQRSNRELEWVAWCWKSVAELRPVAAVPLGPEERPAALAYLPAQDRTSCSSSELSSAPGGPGPGSRMEARRASCAPSAVLEARCPFLPGQSPTHERHRLAWVLARHQLSPLRARPRAMTAARTSGPLAAPRRAAPLELRPGLLGRSEPIQGWTSASALPASDLYRQRARPEDPSGTSSVWFASSAAPVEGRPPKPRR
jgi:hypothetical protein